MTASASELLIPNLDGCAVSYLATHVNITTLLDRYLLERHACDKSELYQLRPKAV